MPYYQDYQYISDCIETAKLDFVAAESHGTASGVLCGHQHSAITLWLDSQLPQHYASNAQLEQLARELAELFNASEQMLLQADFEFTLFLPDDDNLLTVRLEALGEWCSGFLLGLSLVGINDIKSLNADSREFVEDLLEIARVGSSEFDDENADEVAYMELVEYIRFGVISLYEEMLVFHEQQILH